jgi:hypothetical protein
MTASVIAAPSDLGADCGRVGGTRPSLELRIGLIANAPIGIQHPSGTTLVTSDLAFEACGEEMSISPTARPTAPTP